MNQFEVNVSDLRRTHSTEREINMEATVDWALELSKVEAASGGEPNIDVAVTVTPVGGGLLVAGEADFDARHTCHRCLEEWTERFLEAGENELRSNPRDEAAQDEARIKDLQAKVGELVLDRDILKKSLNLREQRENTP